MPGVDGRENKWAMPSPSDFDRWADLVDSGMDPGEAARSLPQKFRGSAQFCRANPERHREVLDAWQEKRREKAGKTGLQTLLEVADDPAAPHAARVSAGSTLVRIGGLLTERVELTGAEGGPVEVNEHRRGLTLDDVARLAAELRSSPEPG